MIAGKVIDVLFFYLVSKEFIRIDQKQKTEQSKIEPFFKFDTSNLH